MNERQRKKTDRFRRAEWLGIIGIFIIAILTGYFFAKNRLEKSEDNRIMQEQSVGSPTPEHTDTDS